MSVQQSIAFDCVECGDNTNTEGNIYQVYGPMCTLCICNLISKDKPLEI